MSDVHYATRTVKRRLSTIEKSSIHAVEGTALIMPAEPNTEVEELRRIGFDADDIVIVESDPTRAAALYEHYFEVDENLHIHLLKVEDYLRRGLEPLTYAHLDFEGNLDFSRLSDLEHLCRARLAPYSRVRFSASITRGPKGGTDKLENWYRQLIAKLLDLGRHLDLERQITFDHYQAELHTMHLSPSHLVGLTIFLGAVFGLTLEEFLAADLGGLSPKGQHLYRDPVYLYHMEPQEDSRTQMMTMWVDLVPAPLEPIASSYERWVGSEVAEFFRGLMTPVPEFTVL